jgi:XRE family transcriptional regulator, fatty acid utilization regulator
MTIADRRKILAGGRMRKLRMELGLSQAAMAQELGISLSYLNLVERNQRPVTAQLLIRLSEVYAVDPRSFAADEEQRRSTELEEIFADPLLASQPVSRAELRELFVQVPATAAALQTLYKAYRGLRDRPNQIEGAVAEPAVALDAVDVLRDFLQSQSNHFPALEELAEALADELHGVGGDIFSALAQRLQQRHNTRTQIVPADVLPNMLRRHDMHRRKLMISELLEQPGRVFQLAFHLGLLEANEAISSIAARIPGATGAMQGLARVMLGNYFAAAVMMPYGRFFEAARTLGYDVDVLAARFGASFEQVAHRLTTLARPSQRGIAFFMIRVDAAGNVSKRFSSGAFPFSRFGGTCPRWNLHHSFANPGRIQTQILQLNDKSTWFSLSRTVQRLRVPWGQPENQFVIGLGCDMKHADKLVYAKGLTQPPTPIGVTCRLCDLPNCAQRAAPPASRPLDVNEHVRGFSPFDAPLGR